MVVRLQFLAGLLAGTLDECRGTQLVVIRIMISCSKITSIVSRWPLCLLQVLERIAEEIDPEGTGLSFDDFLSIVSRMPDFITNFRMAV